MLKLQTLVVEEALETSNYHISTDAPLYKSEGEDITLYDILINTDTPDPDLVVD